MSKNENVLVNRVAQSGLITINLEKYYPSGETVSIDIKDYLWKGMILKEKDFRQAMQDHDWQQYDGKILLVICSADAIVPMWAYMLIATYAAPYTSDIFHGSQEEYLKAHYYRVIKSIDKAVYADERIVIKGCGDKPVPTSAYLQLTEVLRPVARSIMYGEPCSTVPIFKKPRKK